MKWDERESEGKKETKLREIVIIIGCRECGFHFSQSSRCLNGIQPRTKSKEKK